ncbi:hypothetical protein ACLOJK_034986 [Asimina triloba]
MVEMLTRLMGVVARRHLAGMGRGCTLAWAIAAGRCCQQQRMGLGLLVRGGSLSTNGDEHRRGAAGVVTGSGIAGRRTDDGSGERGVGVMGCRRRCWLALEKKASLIVAAASWIWAVDLVRWLAAGGAAARRRDADGWRACRRWTEEIADQAVMGSAAMARVVLDILGGLDRPTGLPAGARRRQPWLPALVRVMERHTGAPAVHRKLCTCNVYFAI